MATTSRTGSRVLRAVLAVLVLLLGLGVIALFLVDTTAIAERIKGRVLPQLSERLGRTITAGPVEASIFPLPSARIEGVRVAGRDPAGPPLLAAEAAEAKVAIWPLVRSLGKEVRVKAVELEGPEVSVVRLPDGTWSFQEVLDRLAAAEEPAPTGPAPTMPETETERRVTIEQLTLTDGALHVIDQAAEGGAARIDVTGIDVTASGLGVGETLELEAAAAIGGGEERNARLTATIDRLPAGFADLPAEAWPSVRGEATLVDVPFAMLEGFLPAGMAAVISGGQLDVDARFETSADGIYGLTAKGTLDRLALRGQPASGKFRAIAELPKGRPDALTAQILDAEVRGPGVDFGATAKLEGLPPRQAVFDLAGERLDLDTVLGVLPPEEAEPPEPEVEGLVPPSVQAKLRDVVVDGTIAFGQVTQGSLTVEDLKARAQLKGGVLTLPQASARFYGGKLDAGGTTADLAAAVPAWNLQARLDGVRLGEAMTAIAGVMPLSGNLDGRLNAAGQGAEWKRVRSNVDGGGVLQLQAGALNSADLGAALAARLSEGLARLGRGGGVLPEGGAATKLRDVLLSFALEDGWMRLERPIRIDAPFGVASLGGRIGLDQRLALKGTAQLEPGFVAQVSGGRLRPDGPVEIPVAIGGTLTAPAVAPIDGEALARAALPTERIEREARRGAEEVEKKARREAKRRAGELLDRFGGGG